ncbi:MAG: phage tail protein [Magnetospirillum sp.]|nr:phage tail protein [Magnetospirillum sp.]
MNELDLLPVFTASGLAAIQAAHQQGMAVKVTHIALGDTGAAIRDGDGLPLVSARAMVALGHERVRVALTAGGDESPTSVTMLAEVPAGDPEFWISEVGFITDTGVLLAVWSSASTNLGWRGAMTPWVFRFVLAWSDLPPNAITIDYNGDAALNAWALDQARTKAKVRHTVEASGQSWNDLDAAQLTIALNALIAAGMGGATFLRKDVSTIVEAGYWTKPVPLVVNAGTATPVLAAGNVFTVTATTNLTLGWPAALAGKAGMMLVVAIQDAAGGRTLTLASGYKLAAGEWSTTANAVNLLWITSDGSGTALDVVISQRGA